MKKSVRVLVFQILMSFCILAVPLPAYAVLIIDTGFPLPTNPLFPSAGSVGKDFGWAVEIMLDQPYRLTGVQGFFFTNLNRREGNLTTVIYGDGGNVPDVNNELFTEDFLVPPFRPLDPIVGWFGPSNFELDLLPGFRRPR
jgi:hypothetical protein